jgi:hypothetical protein
MKKLLCSVFIISTFILSLLTILPLAHAASCSECGTKNPSAECLLTCNLKDKGHGLVRVTNLGEIAATLLKGFLSLVGLIAICVIIWSGFRWMTSRGDSGQIEEAKNTLIQAVIGLLVISLSYAIVQFVMEAVTSAPEEPETPTSYEINSLQFSYLNNFTTIK